MSYIDIRFYFLRDNHERGHIDLIHVPSERQTADILTKPLEQDTFARLQGGAWGLLPLLIADFSLVSFVGFICSSLSFLDLVVALCICIVHLCIFALLHLH